MKKITFLLIFLLCVMSISFAQTMKFEAEEINYGNITKGSNGVREFKFTNDGNNPLIIQSAQSSCGCAVPSYTKEPIMPGQSDVIRVKYDTQRIGSFTKYITVKINDPKNDTKRLTIRGNVLPEIQPTPEKPKSLFKE